MHRAAPAIILLAATAPMLQAVECGGWPSPQQALRYSAVAFLGRAETYRPSPAALLKIIVEEPFKGARPGQVFFLSRPNGYTMAKYEPGDRTLFYLNPVSPGSWHSEACYLNPDRIAVDLLFLRALPASADRTRLAGRVTQWRLLRGEPELPLPGVLVSIWNGKKPRGNPVAETTTNANGVYEVYDLEPGEYTVGVHPPPGLAIYSPLPRPDTETVTVQATDGAYAHFLLDDDTTITGRVLDPSGNPTSNVPIVAEAITTPHPGVQHDIGLTDSLGRFAMNHLPEGTYRIRAGSDPGSTATRIVTLRPADPAAIEMRIVSPLP